MAFYQKEKQKKLKNFEERSFLSIKKKELTASFIELNHYQFLQKSIVTKCNLRAGLCSPMACFSTSRPNEIHSKCKRKRC